MVTAESIFESENSSELDVDPDHLAQFLQPRFSHRVGRYFESLVHYWLERIQQVEMLVSGHQVREGKQTIGELDFIFKDHTGDVHHWETAVKFYLHLPENNVTGSHLIGPNAADTFEKKTAKLFNKQLPLSQRDFPQVTHRRAFVKGRIFYHPSDPSNVTGDSHLSGIRSVSESFPALLSPEHLRSTWIRESEMSWLSDQPSRRFCILRKPNWLAPLFDIRESELQTAEELVATIHAEWQHNYHPVLVSVLATKPSELVGNTLASNNELFADGCVEVSRVFIVSDRWPDIKSRDSV